MYSQPKGAPPDANSRSGSGWRIIAPVLLGLSLAGLLGLAAACAPVVPEPSTPSPEPTITPPADSEQAAIFGEWENSAHAMSYVTGEVNNNDCARCHSPRDWTPTKSEDMPESCSSCKFSVPQPDMVPEAEWNAVHCDSCHRVVDGVVEAEVMWLNAALATGFSDDEDPYQAVGNNMELCQKCHTDRGPHLYQRDLGSDTHTDKLCTDCHDAHTLQAGCIDCHADVITLPQLIPGHDADHQNVSCAACHDASGLEVGPLADGDTWSAFRTTESPGNSGTKPYLSHNLQKAADCARCHYRGNPWGLSETTE